MESDQTVLLVEPDPMLRALLRRALERPDRTVLVAVDIASGLALLAHADEPIDLVIADVLPGQADDELAAEFRERVRGIPVMVISGGAVAPFGAPQLDHPFTRAELEQRIAEVVAVASAWPTGAPQLV